MWIIEEGDKGIGLYVNAYKAKITGKKKDAKCCMCGNVEETVRHVVCECSKCWQARTRKNNEKTEKYEPLRWELTS